MSLKIIRTRKDWRLFSKNLKGTVGLVPTMGALHEGHISLIKQSARQCENTLVTLFVNPIQFGPNEDLDSYPRRFEEDVAICEAAGAIAVFAPSPEEMYDNHHQTRIFNDSVDHLYCGQHRKGHFNGVLTVVAKLLLLSHPTHAFFGEKDRQQLFLIKKMVKDLDLDVEVIGCPIVREASGLALSSRNEYLSQEQKQNAIALNASLNFIKENLKNDSEESWSNLKIEVEKKLLKNGFKELQYLELASQETLVPLSKLDQPAFLLIAAFMGDTRLIDNLAIDYSK